MSEASHQPQFKVIIVGGSIAGLTLANCLSRRNIDFLVLEARPQIAPPEGAGLCVLANGARILDQLGIFDDINQLLEPMKDIYTWREDGKVLSKLDTPVRLQSRHGYPIGWLERHTLLEILFKHIREKDKVLLNKRFIKAERLPHEVIAHCSDCSSFHGNILVAADGVHSSVRMDMWRHMEAIGLQGLLKKDKTTMKSEYSCVYGVSKITLSEEKEIIHRVFGKGYSLFFVFGKKDLIFWFLFSRMESAYHWSNIPRFSRDDLEAHIKPYLEKNVAPGVKFNSIYQSRVSCHYAPIEEATYEHWTWNQFACLGDSIHKMTPNLGSGASIAIENAASLSNYIGDMLDSSEAIGPFLADINKCLSSWASSRKNRTKGICLSSSILTRLEALATWKHKIIALYIFPRLGDLLSDIATYAIVGAASLDFLPLPERSLESGIPFKVRILKPSTSRKR